MFVPKGRTVPYERLIEFPIGTLENRRTKTRHVAPRRIIPKSVSMAALCRRYPLKKLALHLSAIRFPIRRRPLAAASETPAPTDRNSIKASSMSFTMSVRSVPVASRAVAARGGASLRSPIKAARVSAAATVRVVALTEGKRAGTVKWFNSTKGFGFIAPADPNDGDDVFVHQTAIQADGYRSLAEGEEVEYVLEEQGDGRCRAVDVTGPDGAAVKGADRDDGYY